MLQTLDCSCSCRSLLRYIRQAGIVLSTIGIFAGLPPLRAAEESDSTFKDPSPPKVRVLIKVEAPKPKPYARVKFHAKPKPLPKGAVTHDWTSFLGPTHNGISTETKLIKKFPKGGPKVVWEMTKGEGYSSPAIQGQYLVFPHRVGDETIVECLHPATGQKYWEFRYPTKYQDRFGYSSGPRASPVIDDDRVYLYSAEGSIYCLKIQTGQLRWKRDLATQFKVKQDFFGAVNSPLVEGDLLIFNVGAPGGPCVVGINKYTGRIEWGAGNKWGPSYASPMPGVIHGKRRVFVFAGGDSEPPTGGLLSINPANGKVDFEFPFRSRKYESVNASCPVVIGNKVFISASYEGGSALLNIKKDFAYTVDWILADNERNTADDELGIHFSTAVYKDGHLYAYDGRNEPDASLVCLNVKTGKVVWREVPEWIQEIELNNRKLRYRMSTMRGSLLYADGQFIALGEFGFLHLLDLTPKGYKEVDRTWLFAGMQSWALPVLSQGLLYVCQNERDVIHKKPVRLICYDFRAEK